jgi:hypothetical protein
MDLSLPMSFIVTSTPPIRQEYSSVALKAKSQAGMNCWLEHSTPTLLTPKVVMTGWIDYILCIHPGTLDQYSIKERGYESRRNEEKGD